MLTLAWEASTVTLQRKRELHSTQEQLYQHQLMWIDDIRLKEIELKRELSQHEKLLCALQEALHSIYKDLRLYEVHT